MAAVKLYYLCRIVSAACLLSTCHILLCMQDRISQSSMLREQIQVMIIKVAVSK